MYKPSGVEWLGDVPEHWGVTPLKHLASLKGRLGWQGLRADEYTEDGPFLVTSEHFTNDKIDWQRCHHVAIERYALAPEIQLRPDDLLMMKDGAAMGKLAYVDHLPAPACLNSHLLLFRPLDGQFTNRFLYYVLGGPCFKTFMVQERTGTTFFGISQESIGMFPLALPNVAEQREIAAFLDRETSKIDGLVGEQRRLIELLKEKRQAVISHAVTKGLNPHSPLKPSGIEWLGDVPEHWEMLPTKRLFKLIVDPAPDDNDFELLSIYTEIGVRPRKELEAKGNKATTTDGYWRVQKGDLIVNKLLAWMGAIGVSNYDGVTSPAYDILRKARPLVPEFYDFLFRCGICFTEFRRHSRGIMDMRLRLYFDDLGQLPMPAPPESEQFEIVAFLTKETAKLDALTAEAERGIELLQERRTALISAAVTGQIDVRGLVETGAA